MRRGILFDLDGTLIDTGAAIVRMMTDTIDEMGRPSVDETTIREMIGLPLEAGLARFLGRPEDHPDVATGVRLYKARFREWLVPQAASFLFPGVPEGLATLVQKGFVLGLATSKHRDSADAILRSAGIDGLFTAVAGADSVAKAKPHPAMALFVAHELGCRTDDCFMVGDTEHDIAMGKAAGMATCAVTYGIGSREALELTAPDVLAGSFADAVRRIAGVAAPSAVA